MINFFINTCAFTVHELTENKHFEPGGGGANLDPGTREAEAGGSAETVPGQPGLHKKPCFKNKTTQNKHFEFSCKPQLISTY